MYIKSMSEKKNLENKEDKEDKVILNTEIKNNQLVLDYLYYEKYITQQEFEIGYKIREYYLQQKDDFKIGANYYTVKTEGGKDHVDLSELFESHRNWFKIKSILNQHTEFIENTICSNLTIKDLIEKYGENGENSYYDILYHICLILSSLERLYREEYGVVVERIKMVVKLNGLNKISKELKINKKSLIRILKTDKITYLSHYEKIKKYLKIN